MGNSFASDIMNPDYGVPQDNPWSKLAVAVVRQACLDYHKDCRKPKKLPARPMRKRNGVLEEMTDLEYEMWLERQEKDRENRKQRELEFFHSEYCKVLLRQADDELIDRIIARIEQKRDAGLPLIDQRERNNADDFI